jgi:LysR family glycine cleavage system transcriptional activator
MRTPHLNGLRAFETALRTHNFTAAGRELGVTAAAVGQQIRTLEDYLGRKLFERRPTGVVPTAAALRVQDRLTAGMSILSDVVVQLSCVQEQDRVAVTLPESFAENWLTLRLSDFYRDNAGVDLRLDSTNRQVDLFQEDFDFAIRYAAPPEDNLTSIKLFDDSVLPVCTPNFVAEYGLSPDTLVLADVPLIHLVDRTPDPDWVDWPRWADTFGIDLGDLGDLRRGPTFSRFNSGLRAAEAGQGLVLCGIVEAFHAIEDGQLVMPFGFERRCQSSYRYWLVHVEGRRLSKVQRKFVAWIEEVAQAFRHDLDAWI